jgi:hypothetical protein
MVNDPIYQPHQRLYCFTTYLRHAANRQAQSYDPSKKLSTLSRRKTLGEGTTFLPGKRSPLVEQEIAHVEKHGYVILPSIYTPQQVSTAISELDRLNAEAAAGRAGPAAAKGRNAFEGFKTGRIYALPDKSRAFDCFPIHEKVLALNDYFLQPNSLITSWHTVVIRPGEKEQEMHTDDGLIDLPRPRPLMGVVSADHLFPYLSP